MAKCELSNEFEEFWNTYPRKVAKGAARQKYTKALKTASHEDIMAGLERYIAHLDKQKTERQYVCHASTWLHQERWTDELEPVNSGGLLPRQILYWQDIIAKGKPIPEPMKAILRENGVSV